MDSFRPIVETRGVIDLNGTGYRFAGEVVDKEVRPGFWKRDLYGP